jgi:DNA topoisomerase-1
VVLLLESTLIRVGNEEYAQTNESFGLTTLRRRHVRMDRGEVRLRFRGKSGLDHEASVTDPRLRRIIRQCQDLPGQLLFQHVDENGPRGISSQDVNAYLRAAADIDITAKEFRTWIGTLLSACALASLPAPESEREARRGVTQTIAIVSRHLGNTPAVCRRSYVHPAVVDAFRAGSLAATWDAPVRRVPGLVLEERRLLGLLDPSVKATRGRASVARAA